MPDRTKQDESNRDPTPPADKPDEEEGVRRLMRQLLNTPPQPRKGAKKDTAERKDRPERRRG